MNKNLKANNGIRIVALAGGIALLLVTVAAVRPDAADIETKTAGECAIGKTERAAACDAAAAKCDVAMKDCAAMAKSCRVKAKQCEDKARQCEDKARDCKAAAKHCGSEAAGGEAAADGDI